MIHWIFFFFLHFNRSTCFAHEEHDILVTLLPFGSYCSHSLFGSKDIIQFFTVRNWTAIFFIFDGFQQIQICVRGLWAQQKTPVLCAWQCNSMREWTANDIWWEENATRTTTEKRADPRTEYSKKNGDRRQKNTVDCCK